ncbi:GNAT family N-acetyltransferase [Pseudoalteromonas arctica]|uniref:GNAT family N-acetyltransferase n=1 Tax=Pseudoalteromonas arctica TaxID=394751 RepID=A0A7Y0H9I5_9GAMM|nr:GNAT family N-acetyltransferase [Pseudoalteromonas arctica]NMM39500.1 GNAT family N-acetyltransferase [Pseudoalteromonas arctica]
MYIASAEKKDYPILIEIWQEAVSQTHDFLSQHDIDELKSLIFAHYFDAVSLYCCKSHDDKIIGFIGVTDGNIEMLFVEPTFFAKGVGTFLINYAIDNLAATHVDVNEQNSKVHGFYLSKGFEQIGRSELDGQGKPFPLLHMRLAKVAEAD